MTQPTAPERHWGRITDDAIRAVRARIAIPAKREGRQYYEQITADNVRNFAAAMGSIRVMSAFACARLTPA